MPKNVPQRNFVRGLSATESVWSQPPRTVPRISNLLLDSRGALRVCDGSLFISRLNGVLTPGTGPWTAISLFSPANANRYYVGVKKDYTVHLGSSASLTASDGGAGGTLGAGTYNYAVTALDGAGGEALATGSNNLAIAANHLINLNWTAVTNAVAYNVYRAPVNTASGWLLIGTTNVNSFQDNGFPLGTQGLPGINTTQACLLYKIPATSYAAGNIIATLPADPIVPQDGTPGGTGGGGGGSGGGGTGSAGGPPNASGGVVGNLSPLPQLVQFANRMVVAGGNGITPLLITDGNPPTSAAITNTFTTGYPNWIATTGFNAGDLIMPTAGNAGTFVFRCTQSGVSGAGAPTWPQQANQVVADGKVVWTNTGTTNSAPVPRGAAHAIVYAGSLWLYNTSPTTTADNFDGPTCLKMSDLNNPNSWNPINTAFLGKDDGDPGTGLATFSIAADGISPTGSLVAFKNFKTYQVIGVFGAANFAIQEAQTDMGCIAPRSIQFLPGFGICRLTHLGFAIFDGVRDRIISEPIRPYLFGGLSDIPFMDQNFAYFAKGAQAADPPMYMCATPVALNNLAVPGQVTFTFSAGASTWPTPLVTLFFRATRFTLVGGNSLETDVSLEQSQTIGTNNTVLTVQTAGGVLDPLALKYRVYYGNLSGAYTNYVELTPAQMAAGTTFTGTGSFPISGTLNTGIGGLQRVFCYDMVLKAWTIIDLPFAISVLTQVKAPGTVPITVTGSFNDGSVRRLQSGDTTFDGTPVAWLVRSAEVFGRSANERIYCRRLSVRGTTTQTTLTLTASASIDGSNVAALPMRLFMQGNSNGQSDYLAQIDLGYNSMNTHVTLSGSGPATIDSLDWEVVPMPAGVPTVIP